MTFAAPVPCEHLNEHGAETGLAFNSYLSPSVYHVRDCLYVCKLMLL